MNNPETNKFIGAYVDKDLKDKLRTVSEKTGRKMSRIIEEAVEEKVIELEATAG